jgi:hypothetical protein
MDSCKWGNNLSYNWQCLKQTNNMTGRAKSLAIEIIVVYHQVDAIQ